MLLAYTPAPMQHDPTLPIPDAYDALIFDCDGTLVDTMPGHYVVWCEALATVSITLSHDRFHALAGVPSLATVETLAREQAVSCDAIAIAREKDRRYLAREATPSEDAAIEVVVQIARREHGRKKLGVASGNVTNIVERTLRAAGIDGLFSVLVGADQVTHGKPAPDIFLRAASLLEVEPARCVVYDDADLGIRAAHAAGMAVVDVRRWL